MNFASKYILANDEDEYESLSDDEFQQGMCVSDSESSSDSDSDVVAMPRSRGKIGKAMRKKSHWRVRPKEEQMYNNVERCRTERDEGKASDPVEETKKENRRKFRRADTNVVSVNFSTLLEPANMHAGEPVVCEACKAVFSKISAVEGMTEKCWTCEFCANQMPVDIEPEEIPTTEDVTYLLEPAVSTASSSMSGLDQSLVIFCMDVSGSMCVTSEVAGKVKLRGNKQLQRLASFNEDNTNQFLPSQTNRSVTYISRLQSMQAAVHHQLGEMKQHHPNRRVALITFNNDVTIVGDGSQEEIIIAGDKLTDENQLVKAGTDAGMPKGIKESHKVLGEKVYNLEEGGATALGPALVVAVNMAAVHPGSKVILCTDGKANIGVGKLEEASEEQAAFEFYNKMAQTALEKGVTVSVITIQGTDCKLVHLGTLADKTGGQVNIVDPLKLTEEFGNILADPIIATRVQATMILHKQLYIINDLEPDVKSSRAEYNAGNVKKSTTITFEFAKKKKTTNETKEDVSAGDEIGQSSGSGACASNAESQKTDSPSDIPFQLQITYTDTEGNKAMRVITQSMPATTDRKVTEEHANLEILGTHAAKKSADLALQGHFSKSRGVALMNQRLAWRQCHSEAAGTADRAMYKNIYGRIRNMENFVQRRQMTEISRFGRTRSCSSGSDDDSSCDAMPESPMMLGDANASNKDSVPGAVVPAVPPTRKKKKLTKKATPRSKSRSRSRDRALGESSSKSYTKGYIASKFKKMHRERASEMDDDMANMIYNFKSVASSEISAVEPQLAIGSGPASASGDSGKGSKTKKGKK